MDTATESKILEALEQADIRNEKGRDAITKLIMQPESIRLMADAIKATNGERKQYTTGIMALIKHYDCGAAVSLREVSVIAATDTLTANFLQTRVIPILVDLGIILKLGEKSYRWQVAEKIGCKAGILDLCKSWLELTPEKQALRQQQASAADEERLLRLSQKQAAIAQRRKQAVMQAANNAAEAERIAATLPGDNTEPGISGWVKTNPILTASMALVVFVVVGGNLSGSNIPGNAGTVPIEIAAFGQQQPVTTLPTTPTTAATTLPTTPTPPVQLARSKQQ